MPVSRPAIFNRRMLICLFTGFASGLPLYVLISLVPAWLRSEQVELRDIGLFALIGLPYTWKFLWAPLLERYPLPLLGRRRGWMLATQLGTLAAIAALPLFDARSQLGAIATLCTLIAVLSATQDIVIDAYRRELLPDAELGLGNALHVNLYRLAGLIPGSLALILADHLPWQPVFAMTAAFMLAAIGLTLSIREPPHAAPPPGSLRDSVILPFQEFFERDGSRRAWAILAFLVLYKLGDNLATALATPFYLDLGFSLSEIGVVAKQAALWPMIVGSLAGGLLMVRIGIDRALWLFGVVQVISILGFAVLARVGYNLWLLAAAIGFEYLGVGLGSAALIAFMARTTSRAHTATQLALFTALAALPRTLVNAGAGYVVEAIGWENFFYLCALLSVPGMLLLPVIAPWRPRHDTKPATPIVEKP